MESDPPFFRSLVRASVWLGLVVAFSLPLWPAYAVARLFAARPPVVPSPRLARRIFGLTAGPNPEAPTARARLFVLLALSRRILAAPLWGFSWWIDEILYGRRLDGANVAGAVIELSAARSGSTQLAHYLEDDPRLAAPNVFQALLPFLWLWRLAARFDTPAVREHVTTLFLARMPSPHLERHEADPFRTDTLESIWAVRQLVDLAMHLGADMIIQDYDLVRVTPDSCVLWEDFVSYTARLGRKTLLFAGPGHRLLIKGHFLAAADGLAAVFPDARFLTVVRAPAARIQSVINFHHTQPSEPGLGYVRWPWLVTRALAIEPAYAEREHAWFTAPEGPRRTVVRFRDYLRDLPGTLGRVYAECLDEATLPTSLPREHAPRTRTNYTFDRDRKSTRLNSSHSSVSRMPSSA